MNLSQNENRSQKLILPILLFLLVVALVILGSVLYFQGKNVKIQNQTNSIQKPKGSNLPVPSNVQEPSNSPDKIPSTNGKKIPPPLP